MHADGMQPLGGEKKNLRRSIFINLRALVLNQITKGWKHGWDYRAFEEQLQQRSEKRQLERRCHVHGDGMQPIGEEILERSVFINLRALALNQISKG